MCARVTPLGGKEQKPPSQGARAAAHRHTPKATPDNPSCQAEKRTIERRPWTRPSSLLGASRTARTAAPRLSRAERIEGLHPTTGSRPTPAQALLQIRHNLS